VYLDGCDVTGGEVERRIAVCGDISVYEDKRADGVMAIRVICGWVDRAEICVTSRLTIRVDPGFLN
jgi:hypothetical protein